MFFAYVKNQWNEGNVKVGLPAAGSEDTVSLESTVVTSIAIRFLTAKEKKVFATLTKINARKEKSNTTIENDTLLTQMS